MKKLTKQTRIALLILLVLFGIFAGVWFATRPAPSAGTKTITVTVTHSSGEQKDFSLTTAAENLRGALEEAELVSGEESSYGLYITTVDGESADYSANGSWWCILREGEVSQTGADSTMIQDGECYELRYTTEFIAFN